MSYGLGAHFLPDLSLRERRAIRARVRWLAHCSGQTEIDVLALTLYRVHATERGGMTLQQRGRLNALASLLTAEINADTS